MNRTNTINVEIDGTLITDDIRQIRKLNYYDIICIIRTLESEIALLEIYNKTDTRYCQTLDNLLYRYLCIKSEYKHRYQDKTLEGMTTYYKETTNKVINCRCPYKYRDIKYFTWINTNVSLHVQKTFEYAQCLVCNKKLDCLEIMARESRKKERKYGLYLASELTNTNILNVLPVDLCKSVLKYI